MKTVLILKNCPLIIGAHTTPTALYIDSSGVCTNNGQFLFVCFMLGEGGGGHHDYTLFLYIRKLHCLHVYSYNGYRPIFE